MVVAFLGFNRGLDRALERAGMHELGDFILFSEPELCERHDSCGPVPQGELTRAVDYLVQLRMRLDLLGHSLPGKRHARTELLAAITR